MVQAKWGHLNRDYSLLTKVQAIFLDGNFVKEHGGRSRAGQFFNCNGTAGIWRKACIEEAGGWQHDTLTEDLDLSYRAQMAGWKFVYLPQVVAPAELPVTASAWKSQQFRWAKESVQTARKLLPKLLKSRLPWGVKAEADPPLRELILAAHGPSGVTRVSGCFVAAGYGLVQDIAGGPPPCS